MTWATWVESLELRRLLAAGPLVITKGGTYTGSWENLTDRTPVITIKTTEPVVIQNSLIKGKGHLIQSTIVGANITVRDSSGFGVNPNVAGESPGRFVNAEGAKNLVIDNNYLESTAGIHVLGYDGNHTTAQTIKVTNNRAKNIDGRRSNAAGGWMDFNVRTNVTTGAVETGFTYAQFLQLDKVQFVPGIEIAWNEVVNEVGKSRVEDNISIYRSSGTETSPISIHDNYIEGAYTIKPAQADSTSGGWNYDWSYSGGGIMLGDGFGTTLNGDAGFVKAFGNTVIGTTNYGMATAAGHDTEFYGNRIVSSGKTPDGKWNPRQNVGMYIWDSYGLGATRFFSNTAHNNTVGWVKSDGVRNDWWNPHVTAITNNIRLPDPITRQTELNEAAAWHVRRYPPTGNIAGTIFNDVDGDALRDTGDNGIAGFTAYVDLDGDGVKDSNEPTSKSSSTGHYQFNALKLGKYRVRIVTNSGWRITTASSALLTVTDSATTVGNFGVSQTTLVSGTVFTDANQNGIIDTGESGLPSWRVYIDTDGDNTLDPGERSTLTDTAGKFSFIGLPVGTYQIRVVANSNYRLIQPSSGYRSVTLSSGEVITGRLFGVKRL